MSPLSLDPSLVIIVVVVAGIIVVNKRAFKLWWNLNSLLIAPFSLNCVAITSVCELIMESVSSAASRRFEPLLLCEECSRYHVGDAPSFAWCSNRGPYLASLLTNQSITG